LKGIQIYDPSSDTLDTRIASKTLLSRGSHDSRSKTEKFIEKSSKKHGDRYAYLSVNYINSKSKVTILCNEHGEFSQRPNNHLNGQGCNKCGILSGKDQRSGNTKDFIEKANVIHGDKYDYSFAVYINVKSKLLIICKKHKQQFTQRPNDHLSGQGCPLCINKSEAKLLKQIKLIYSLIVIQFTNEWCKKEYLLRFDFCIPDCNIIIELDGPQHFKQIKNWQSPELQFINDKFKEKCANENGYSTIRLLQADVWNDKYDWLTELCDAVELNKCNGDKVTNTYLCKHNEYHKFLGE
jgi:very-short-patch-repair endonuclease